MVGGKIREVLHLLRIVIRTVTSLLSVLHELIVAPLNSLLLHLFNNSRRTGTARLLES